MDHRVVQDPAATRTIRRAMVDNQIRTFDVTDQALLERFYTVPREAFLPDSLASLAYSDAVLTVGEAGKTKRALLVPLVLARMLQGVAAQPTDRVLTVGGATGYAAALLAGLAADVTALETDEAFALQSRPVFQALGLRNVTAVTGPLPEGQPAKAPFDVIVVEGAAEGHLESLIGQLAPRGRLVVIQKVLFDGVRRNGKATLFERFGDDIGSRPLFDSSAAVLPEFAVQTGFAF